MNKYSQYAFYGTLRKEMENYWMYAAYLKYQDTVTLPGYRMFSLVDYPYAIRTGNPDNIIVAELFKITERETEEIIHHMELEAGYMLAEIPIAGNKFGIYLFENFRVEDCEIPEGDWAVFSTQSRFLK